MEKHGVPENLQTAWAVEKHTTPDANPTPAVTSGEVKPKETSEEKDARFAKLAAQERAFREYERKVMAELYFFHDPAATERAEVEKLRALLRPPHAWRGQIAVVHSLDEAIEVIGEST